MWSKLIFVQEATNGVPQMVITNTLAVQLGLSSVASVHAMSTGIKESSNGARISLVAAS
jgi:hypothetical protein